MRMLVAAAQSSLDTEPAAVPLTMVAAYPYSPPNFGVFVMR
jgi:hypothetical protein